jgi:hypothetical protein
MQLSVEQSVPCGYLVEVSGWDRNERFFVENSELSWDETEGKRVGLRHMLDKESMVFVRLLQRTTIERTHPIPYTTEYVGMDAGKNYQFLLKPTCPQV